MPDNEQQVLDLDHDLIADTARIFVQALPDDMCSILGPEFLTKYFLPYLLSDGSHIGLVARLNNQVTGFVLGAGAADFFRRFMTRHTLQLAWYAFMAILRSPGRLAYFAEVARLLSSRGSFRPAPGDFELLYISVDSAHQNFGIGSKLVTMLLDRVNRNEFDRCVVKTLVNTPDTIRFYEQQGFTPLHYNLSRVWLAIPIDTQTGQL